MDENKTVAELVSESNLEEELKQKIIELLKEKDTTNKELMNVIDTWKKRYNDMCKTAETYKNTIIEFAKECKNDI